MAAGYGRAVKGTVLGLAIAALALLYTPPEIGKYIGIISSKRSDGNYGFYEWGQRLRPLHAGNFYAGNCPESTLVETIGRARETGSALEVAVVNTGNSDYWLVYCPKTLNRDELQTGLSKERKKSKSQHW